MSKSNTHKNEYLKLLFQNTAMANVGDASGLQPSAADGNLYVALHPSWPGLSSTQDSNEAAYTGYSRVGVSRTGSTGWTVSTNNASNTGATTFPQCTGSPETEFFASIGKGSSGATDILYIIKLGFRLGSGVVEAADLTNNDVTLPSHGLVADDRVAFFTIDGVSLPTGITAGTVYWVISTGLSTDTFRVSTTQGGGALDITAVGQAKVFNMVGLAVSNGITPQFAAGELDVYEN